MERRNSYSLLDWLGSIIKMMKHEYHEGPRAGENFKKLATALLQKPKTVVALKKQPQAKPVGRHKG